MNFMEVKIAGYRIQSRHVIRTLRWSVIKLINLVTVHNRVLVETNTQISLDSVSKFIGLYIYSYFQHIVLVFQPVILMFWFPY